MNDVITFTIPYDIHTSAVREGVIKYGAHFEAIYPCLYPYQSSIAFSTEPKSSWKLDINDVMQRYSRSTFWNRRRGKIQAPYDIADEDRDIAFNHGNRMIESVGHLLSSSCAYTVNDYSTYMAVESSKMLQLATALRCGLSVPRTLISNDPIKIRALLAGHTRFIGKSLGPAVWRETDGVHLSVTAFVEPGDLPSDHHLRSAPVILQEAIDKQYEVRANIMGSFVQAARIESADPNGADIDWRPNQRKMQLSPHKLPGEVEQKLIAIMRRLGLSFGAVDLIVTSKNDHVFLEVNQMGQFLWIEELCPDIHTLDNFCRFLVSGTNAFDGSGKSAGLRFQEIRDRAWDWNLSEAQEHGFDFEEAKQKFAF